MSAPKTPEPAPIIVRPQVDDAPKIDVSGRDKIIRAIWEEYGIKAVYPQDRRMSEGMMDKFNFEWNMVFGGKA